MHLKNFSLIETFEGSGEYILSPAYDLLPVNLIMPADKEQFALSMNGKKKNVRKNDFREFAAYCNLPEKVSERMLDKLKLLQPIFTKMVEESLLPEKM